MPLHAGASPVAIAAVAAGVMLGKTETASQTASPLWARAARCGAPPSRMAARSTSGLMPSSTRSRTGLGVWFSAYVKSGLFYPFERPREVIPTHPVRRRGPPGDAAGRSGPIGTCALRRGLLAGCRGGAGRGGLLVGCLRVLLPGHRGGGFLSGRWGVPARRRRSGFLARRPWSGFLVRRRRSGGVGGGRRGGASGVAEDGLVAPERVPVLSHAAYQARSGCPARVHRAARERGARARAAVAE